MSFTRVATNMASVTARRNLEVNSSRLQSSIAKLSSGMRITRAADDAAGLAISESLRADIRSLAQAKRNALDGISLAQTAEGGLEEIGNILTRMKELATEAASDTIGTSEKALLDKEFQQLISEIDRIANATEFNGQDLLDGSAPAALDIQVGEGTSATEDVIQIDITALDATTVTLGVDGLAITSKTAAQAAMTAIDTAIDTVSGYRATIGAVQNRLEKAINNLSVRIENLTAADSRIRDVDFAEETARFTASQVMVQAGTAVLAQANQLPFNVMGLLR